MFLFPVCLLVSSFSVAVHVLSAVADKEARTFPEWAEVYYSGCYFVVASGTERESSENHVCRLLLL